MDIDIITSVVSLIILIFFLSKLSQITKMQDIQNQNLMHQTKLLKAILKKLAGEEEAEKIKENRYTNFTFEGTNQGSDKTEVIELKTVNKEIALEILKVNHPKFKISGLKAE